MSRFALVALLPEPADDAARYDFLSREFETCGEVGHLLDELERDDPRWRAVTIVHTEDLPLLMEQPRD